jgi:uncharacterized protein
MPDRVGFPAGVPSWIDTTQPDPAAAAAFYGPLFGWEFEERMPPGSDGSYLMATLDGREVAAVSSAAPGSPVAAWNTYVQVDSADEVAVTVRAAGGTVITEPFDVFDAGRMAVCADPAGATFSLWRPGTTQGAEIVNAPGSWNFSELYADDLDAAQRFYGAVFGWEADGIDMGALAGLMVRLPGYADFLEQFDPGIKQRHADFGAPPGFSDCVAWILPLDEGAPHWNVTFSVADTDAVAATAQQHGGTVVVEPLDVPPVRTAVLRDPAGAQFTVSAYTPG